MTGLLRNKISSFSFTYHLKESHYESRRGKVMGRNGHGLCKSTIKGYYETPQPGELALTVSPENQLTAWELSNAGLHERNISHTYTCSVVRMRRHHPMRIRAGIQVKLHVFPNSTALYSGRFTPGVHGSLVGRRADLGAMVEGKIPTAIESRSLVCLQALYWLTNQAYIQTDFICYYSDIICWGDAVITHCHSVKLVALHCFQPLILKDQ